MKYTVILRRQKEGGYTVQCLEVPGAISQGETREEALRNIKEAIQLVRARRAAGIKEGEVELIATGGEVVLRPTNGDMQSVNKWYREMISSRVEAKKLSKGTGKWVSPEYGRRKLGL